MPLSPMLGTGVNRSAKGWLTLEGQHEFKKSSVAGFDKCIRRIGNAVIRKGDINRTKNSDDIACIFRRDPKSD